jgi:hypothetical protein
MTLPGKARRDLARAARWLAPLGFLLAASLAVSGLGYILLAQGLASAVYVSGILLLAFITSTGVTLGVAPRTPAVRAA